jgi:DNA replication protein DnaC
MVVRAKEALMSIDILFIDDLGSEMKEDLLIQGFWNSLIKQRLEDEKTTFITTNQSLEQLKETFDDRFVSRLNSMTQIGFGDDMTDRRVG